MTADLISPPFRRHSASWAGRASQRRREQVRGRSSDTGPGVDQLWEALVDVLRSIDTPSSAVLCTAAGAPVAAYGLSRAELPLASRRTGRLFAARAHSRESGGTSEPGAVETLELTSGLRHTVIASVPAPGDHLLCVSAEGVSLPLLRAWTRCAAEDLREALADQELPSSSSAAR